MKFLGSTKNHIKSVLFTAEKNIIYFVKRVRTLCRAVWVFFITRILYVCNLKNMFVNKSALYYYYYIYTMSFAFSDRWQTNKYDILIVNCTEFLISFFFFSIIQVLYYGNKTTAIYIFIFTSRRRGPMEWKSF